MIAYSEVILWIGIFTLLFGFIYEYRKHHVRILGFALLGIFWVTEAPYFISISDYVNAILCIITLPLFLYFAYNEYLSKKWDEDPEVMRFLAGGISIGMLIYFSIQRMPIVSGYLIKVVADHTVFITELMGYDFTVGPIVYGETSLFYRTSYENIKVGIQGSNINIILACTGLQAIAAGAALIYSTEAVIKRKIKSLLVIVPTLYIANILRNALIIYLTYENITSFDTAHNQIAKTGSVILLIILMLIVFEIMPEFYENIMSVISLPKRKPIHQKQQRQP
ncbi:MAG: archaeosortase A [Candidatus Saliniplasma sp.]